MGRPPSGFDSVSRATVLRGSCLLRNLNLAVSAALTIEPDPGAPRDKPVLLQKFLAVSHAAADLVDRFGDQQQRGARHILDGLPILHGLDEMVVQSSRRRDDFGWRETGHRNAILEYLRGESLGHPLEGGLLGAITDRTRHELVLLIWTTAGTDCRA